MIFVIFGNPPRRTYWADASRLMVGHFPIGNVRFGSSSESFILYFFMFDSFEARFGVIEIHKIIKIQEITKIMKIHGIPSKSMEIDENQRKSWFFIENQWKTLKNMKIENVFFIDRNFHPKHCGKPPPRSRWRHNGATRSLSFFYPFFFNYGRSASISMLNLRILLTYTKLLPPTTVGT